MFLQYFQSPLDGEMPVSTPSSLRPLGRLHRSTKLPTRGLGRRGPDKDGTDVPHRRSRNRGGSDVMTEVRSY